MAKAHLYRYFDASGQLLYVGVSANTMTRLAQHRDGGGWAHDVARINFEGPMGRSEALRLEAEAIEKERPKFNRRNPAYSRAIKGISAKAAPMVKTADAVACAGGVAGLCVILGVTRQAVSQWGDYLTELQVYRLRARCPRWFRKGGPLHQAPNVPTVPASAEAA